MSNYATDKRLAEIYGFTEGAVAKYREKVTLTTPKHYFKATNGRWMWDVEAFEQWLVASRYTKGGSESRSNGKVNGSMRQPVSKPQQQA